ncbi:hypothetical protein PPERSA_09401 [Pseudocohnilembus persalinus]|uniref:Uncharacterized protein n=1 Tax=Pseudocohnilembus persalinus TaxID=266149 RepID=A0A0V0R516_PSEPJ|nr:hypothetical protein PPERSA_09401 [Pseudocohnilembus persalinus]|eukprot:KRX09571.1 hypothetical protein PPERSA_09401 [Pseudocohnilembus persalinus]
MTLVQWKIVKSNNFQPSLNSECLQKEQEFEDVSQKSLCLQNCTNDLVQLNENSTDINTSYSNCVYQCSLENKGQNYNGQQKFMKFDKNKQNELLQNPYIFDGKTLLDLNCEQREKKKVILRVTSPLVYNYFRSRCDYEIYRQKDYKTTQDYYFQYAS